MERWANSSAHAITIIVSDNMESQGANVLWAILFWPLLSGLLVRNLLEIVWLPSAKYWLDAVPVTILSLSHIVGLSHQIHLLLAARRPAILQPYSLSWYSFS